jgi:hypothetical protein
MFDHDTDLTINTGAKGSAIDMQSLHLRHLILHPLLSEYGTYKKVKAGF